MNIPRITPNNPGEKNELPSNPPKRKRQKVQSCTPFKQEIQKIKDLSNKRLPSSLDQFRVYHSLVKHSKKSISFAQESEKESYQQAITEIDDTWKSLKTLKDDELKKKVKSEQDKFSGQLEFTIEADQGRKYFNVLKRVYSVFLELHQEDKAKPDSLSRVVKRARFFEDSPASCLSFLIEHDGESKIITISKASLLPHQSVYFQSFENSENTIKLDNISVSHFERLKNWIENPSQDHFEQMDTGEVLDFMEAVQCFNLPSLIEDCDKSLARKIKGKSCDEVLSIKDRIPCYLDLKDPENDPFLETRLILYDYLKRLGVLFERLPSSHD